jgi:hypothetical protein
MVNSYRESCRDTAAYNELRIWTAIRAILQVLLLMNGFEYNEIKEVEKNL